MSSPTNKPAVPNENPISLIKKLGGRFGGGPPRTRADETTQQDDTFFGYQQEDTNTEILHRARAAKHRQLRARVGGYAGEIRRRRLDATPIFEINADRSPRGEQEIYAPTVISNISEDFAAEGVPAATFDAASLRPKKGKKGYGKKNLLVLFVLLLGLLAGTGIAVFFSVKHFSAHKSTPAPKDPPPTCAPPVDDPPAARGDDPPPTGDPGVHSDADHDGVSSLKPCTALEVVSLRMAVVWDDESSGKDVDLSTDARNDGFTIGGWTLDREDGGSSGGGQGETTKIVTGPNGAPAANMKGDAQTPNSPPKTAEKKAPSFLDPTSDKQHPREKSANDVPKGFEELLNHVAHFARLGGPAPASEKPAADKPGPSPSQKPPNEAPDQVRPQGPPPQDPPPPSVEPESPKEPTPPSLPRAGILSEVFREKWGKDLKAEIVSGSTLPLLQDQQGNDLTAVSVKVEGFSVSQESGFHKDAVKRAEFSEQLIKVY